MKSLPAIWFALTILALMAMLTFWIDRAVQPPAPKRDGSARHDPDYTVINFTSSKSDMQGNPRYSLSGAEMRHFPDDDSTELVRPAFAQFSLKRPTTRVEGDRGLISANGENVYFMDNVKVVRAATAQKGELTVLTDYLHIIPEQSLIKTDRAVTILQAPRTVIHATGMEYYKDERVLKLYKRVKVHYERPDAPALPPLAARALIKAPPVSAVRGSKPQARTATTGKIAVTKKNSKKASAKKVKASKPKVKKSKTRTGKSKSRVRRHYENSSN